MHSQTIVLAIGLLAAPLSLLVSPDPAASSPNGLWTAAASLDETVNGRPLLPAPVPDELPAGVAPVDRVAGAGSRTLSAGPLNSTPFSATPTGTLSSGGEQESQRDRSLSPTGTTGVTPNLGR